MDGHGNAYLAVIVISGILSKKEDIQVEFLFYLF